MTDDLQAIWDAAIPAEAGDWPDVAYLLLEIPTLRNQLAEARAIARRMKALAMGDCLDEGINPQDVLGDEYGRDAATMAGWEER